MSNSTSKLNKKSTTYAVKKKTLRITLSAMGSRGDVYPVLSIAKKLQDRGHECTVLVPPDFSETARSLGLNTFVYSMDMKSLSDKMKTGIAGLSQVLKWFTESTEQNTEFMLNHTKNADVIITSSAEIHAPTVAEITGTPHYKVIYAPWLPGDHTPPLLPVTSMPRPANILAWYLINQGFYLFFGRPLNRIRRRHELPKIKIMHDYLNGNCRNILSINPVLSPPVPAWKWDHVYAGPCLNTENADLPEKILDFISSGPKPVYIGFGSMNIKKPGKFISHLRSALKGTDIRIILSRGWQGINIDMPRQVLVIDDVPHQSLFPLMAGVCHHGGSGTTHMAAWAGVPQCIMPVALDQFYWGSRTMELGIGTRPVPAKKITIQKIQKSLDALINDRSLSGNARELGIEMRKQKNGADVTAQLITYEILQTKRGSHEKR